MKAAGVAAPLGETGVYACPPASLGRHQPDGECTPDWTHPTGRAPREIIKKKAFACL